MLSDAERPCALYITPQSKLDDQRHLPAISITAKRQIDPNTETLIFDVSYFKDLS